MSYRVWVNTKSMGKHWKIIEGESLEAATLAAAKRWKDRLVKVDPNPLPAREWAVLDGAEL